MTVGGCCLHDYTAEVSSLPLSVLLKGSLFCSRVCIPPPRLSVPILRICQTGTSPDQGQWQEHQSNRKMCFDGGGTIGVPGGNPLENQGEHRC